MATLLRHLSGSRVLRRRVVLASVAAVGVLAVAGTTLRGQPDAATTCVAGANRVHALWSSDARDRVRDRFMAVEHLTAFQRVDLSLHDYADTWAALREEACRSRAAAPDLDRRLGCLDDRASHVEALIGVLAAADREVARNATAAVAKLPSLGACTDDDRLARRGEPDAAVARPARDLMAEAHALYTSGRLREAAPVADLAVAQAHRLEQPRVLVRALLQRATIRQQLSSIAEARSDFEQAVSTAVENNADDLAVEASTGLIWADVHAREFDAATRWKRFAEAALARIGDDPQLAATLGLAVGHLYSIRGELDPARAALADAEALARDSDDVPPAVHASLLNAAGNLEVRADALERARPLLAEAQEILEGVLGPHHPQVATIKLNRGVVEGGLGRPEVKLELLRAARADLVAATGEGGETVAMCDVNIAETLSGLGDYAAAETHLRRAESEFRAVVGEEHVWVGNARIALARALAGQERYEEARQWVEAARTVIEGSGGEEHPLLPFVFLQQGVVQQGTGDLVGARASFERARDLAAAQPGIELVAEAEFRLAQTLWDSPAERAAGIAVARGALSRLTPDRKHDLLRSQIAEWLRTVSDTGASG